LGLITYYYFVSQL